MDRLSVIVPIYGVESYLRRALDSLKAQSFRDWEAILVDDGSVDSCGAIVDEYAKSDARFVAIHQPNGGYGKAVNAGLERAKGEWIAIFEPDDWVDSDFYARLLERAEGTRAEMVKTGFAAFWDDDGSDAMRESFDDESERGVLDAAEVPRMLSIHPSIWTCLCRRDFLMKESIRMEETPGASWQDNLFQVKTVLSAKSIAFASGCGYHYRMFRKKGVPPAGRVLATTRGVRRWIAERGGACAELMAALAMRELAYVGDVFDVWHPFVLLPVMRTICEDLRKVSEARLSELGVLRSRMVRRYRWTKASPLAGLLRLALSRARERLGA